jgi:hypothetical protein
MATPTFTFDQKLKLVHNLGRDLEKTEVKRQAEHE